MKVKVCHKELPYESKLPCWGKWMSERMNELPLVCTESSTCCPMGSLDWVPFPCGSWMSGIITWNLNACYVMAWTSIRIRWIYVIMSPHIQHCFTCRVMAWISQRTRCIYVIYSNLCAWMYVMFGECHLHVDNSLYLLLGNVCKCNINDMTYINILIIFHSCLHIEAGSKAI